jgi:hypothetical protein
MLSLLFVTYNVVKKEILNPGLRMSGRILAGIATSAPLCGLLGAEILRFVQHFLITACSAKEML